MAVGNHQQVIAGVAVLAERAVRGVEAGYRREVTAPLARRLGRVKPTGDDAANYRNLRNLLGGPALHEMKTTALAKAIADAGTQAGLIGHTAATPREQ